MKRDEMLKYSAELVVKNNPDEAVKLLMNYEKVNNKLIHENNLLRDEILDLNEIIDKAIKYIERNCLEFNVKYACQGLNNDKVDVLLDILRGEK